MLTLDQFIATKKSVTGQECCDMLKMDKDYFDAPKALVYDSNFYIEDWEQHEYEHSNGIRGRYYLIIDRDDWISDDLPFLEGLIYGFYVEENEEV